MYYKTSHQDYENNFIINEDHSFTNINHIIGRNNILNKNYKLDEIIIKRMIKFCKVLGQKFDFVRLDFYYTKNKILL